MSGHGRRSGFALLITITLLAFLVLLLVSLASLTRVETQVASNSQKLSLARQNAMLALNLALGHLQQSAGPDLRLSSRADLAAAGQNAHFTGIWKPGDAAPFTWLISGNQNSTNPSSVTPASSPAPTGAAGADEVLLVGDASVSAVGDRVKLTRQTITVAQNTVHGLDPVSTAPMTIGHFAYWIGDEGVKVSTALNDQTGGLNYDNRLVGTSVSNTPTTGANWPVDTELRDELRQLAPVHPNLTQLFSHYSSTPAINAALPQAISYEQLALLDASNLTHDELRAHFHDATTVSRAVLVDHTLPNGGLRQDLSDSPDVFPSAFRNFVKERAGSRTGLQASHYQKQSETATDTAFPLFSRGPVLTECAIRFQVYRNSAKKLALKYEIQAELWSPYACTLYSVGNPPSATVLSLQFSNLPEVTVTVGGASYTLDLNVQLKQGGVYGPITANVTNGATGIDSWAPGQIVVVKGGGGTNAISPTGSAHSADANVGGAGAGLPAALPDPIVGGLAISVTAVNAATKPFTVQVNANGNPLAFYRPSIDFTAVTTSRSSAEMDSNAGFLFGYAFDFRDDIRDWIDPTRSTAQDPRRTNLDGTFYEPGFPYWDADPTNNIGDMNQAGTDTFNTTRSLVLFDLPNQEPVSMGSLQHVIGEKPYRLGNPNVAPLTTVNDTFDRFYFSTLPRWYAWTALNPPVLPNRYIQVHVPDPASPPSVGDRFGSNSTAADYMLDRTHAAKYLLMRGAFNINSTSQPAWQAVLAGIQISNWSYGGATPKTVGLNNAFFRLSQGAQELSTDPTAAPDATNAFVRGALTLSESQVQQMAASIVAQLKAHGRPYATLRDFIDAGVITAAIAAAGINSADLAAVPAYSPGWLSQADVLTALAPFITPRSDTFRIRAYGDASNPVTDTTEGRVWCEAIVQRMPELTAPASGALVPATDPLTPSATKYPFGRQFKIISFRWLSSSDI